MEITVNDGNDRILTKDGMTIEVKKTGLGEVSDDRKEEKAMDKPISEMNNKELFCALTGEYGVVKQAYVQKVFRKYKALHGEYGELSDMVKAAIDGALGDLDEA